MQNYQGLTEAAAAERLSQFGLNELPVPPLASPFKLFLSQFLSPFIYMLIIAAAISFSLGQTPSGFFILAVLLINALIGTIQEYSAQKAASALRNMVKGTCHVIRDGMSKTIEVESVVPGDLVVLSSGDKVPADIKLMDAQDLSVDESMLTGESVAAAKNHGATVDIMTPLAERYNQAFAGTIVTHGRCHGEVFATATQTEIGKIAQSVSQESASQLPLVIRVKRFTYQVAFAILIAIGGLIGLMLIKGGYSVTMMLLMSIGLAVSVIPEGLPAALTVALAMGMRRMAQNNVIIRKLIAVEALGSCTLICSDKTGTLTVNELTIRGVELPDGQFFSVTGEGVTPGGEVLGEPPNGLLEKLCLAGALANESELDYSGGEWVSDGDIVDVAFLVLAKKLGMKLSEIRQQQRLKLIPYESEKAFSASLNHTGEKKAFFLKGSPEKVFSMCASMQLEKGIVPIDHEALQKQVTQLAEQGFRLIALAEKNIEYENDESLKNMTYLGMVAMIDPLRPEAKRAIEKCRVGGIDVAMVTGDHPATAKAIAIDLGLCDQEHGVVTGAMLNAAEDHESLRQLIIPTRVFARIEPQQKELVVKTFMDEGHYVGVTGDGVNDAPAMRQANVAIAMGKRGTDVAKETADLIITDDNFASIISGVEQGRVVYNNIRKVIGLLVATGFSAILLFFLCVLAGLPMPLIAVQLLWLNLVANGLQDVALAFESKEGNELTKPPRDPQEPVFEKHIIEHVCVAGGLMGLVAFANYFYTIQSGASVEAARNLTLMLMVLFGNIHALNSRSESRSIFNIPLSNNWFLMLAVPIAQLVHIGAMYLPGLSTILELQPITLVQWLQLFVLAMSLLVAEEVHKYTIRLRMNKRRNSYQTGSELAVDCKL